MEQALAAIIPATAEQRGKAGSETFAADDRAKDAKGNADAGGINIPEVRCREE